MPSRTAEALAVLGRPQQALALLRQSVDACRSALSKDHPNTLMAQESLGAALADGGTDGASGTPGQEPAGQAAGDHGHGGHGGGGGGGRGRDRDGGGRGGRRGGGR